jgi:hypothetical protein
VLFFFECSTEAVITVNTWCGDQVLRGVSSYCREQPYHYRQWYSFAGIISPVGLVFFGVVFVPYHLNSKVIAGKIGSEQRTKLQNGDRNANLSFSFS